MDPEETVPPASQGNSATAAAAAPSNVTASSDRQAATIRYVDRTDIEETFADSITRLMFDGYL